MVTMGAPRGRRIDNPDHQHAFIIAGREALFGVHMTQYYAEPHKYQLVYRFELSGVDHDELNRQREQHPKATFVLCNAADDLYSVPALACGARAAFKGDVFHGLPPLPSHPGSHYFPWARDYCRPIIEGATVSVTRVVMFRPFVHHEPPFSRATYLLWGEDGEAHMANLQRAPLASGQFETPLYGPGVDHVLSLAEAPDWIAEDMLRAGVAMGAPSVVMSDPAGRPTVPCEQPFPLGEDIPLLYRGVGDPLMAQAGPCWLYATGVCCSPPVAPCDGLIDMTTMPDRYLEEYDR